MDTTGHSLKPFLPVLIFILIIIGIYIIGQTTVFTEDETEENANQAPVVGSIAPDFAIKDVRGSQAPLSFVYSKKPVLLIFWSSWCPYCAQELSDLLSFGNKYRSDIQVVLVMSGESKQTIEKYIADKKIPFLTSLDTDRSIWQLYYVRGTPSHFLINTSGEIITDHPGVMSFPRLEDLTRYIR